ncbi:MAG: tol-pal system protein YbgF [Gammaproteobacteria bacterium]|nr:tol-pal system protein YbgF [Gammaproteobacteria bacterium]
MILRRAAACLAFAGCLVHTAGALAQAPVVDARELDERLKRIERLFGSDSLFKLFDEVESLGAEVRELRGQLETLSHTVHQLKERQRELYLDVDQRLRRIETATPTQAASPAQQPGVSPAVPAAPTETAAPSQPVPAPATPSTADTSSTGGVDPFAEQQAYQSAFDLLKSGRYEDAAVAFQQFIVEFPAGTYADNAQYWLGETFYITRQFDRAVQEFDRLVSMHPNSQKLTHALLKIGYAHDELGNQAEAEQVLGALIEGHPQSAAAGLARKRLLTIRQ